MDWELILAQAGLVFLKEGLNFVFSSFKDQKRAEDAQKKSEVEAQKDCEGCGRNKGY